MLVMENAYALVVGIANYQKINRLPETVLKDARDIYDLLISPQHCGYLRKNVQLLLDGQATQVALYQALTDLVQRSNEDSTVFIYISSHGGQIEFGPHAGEYLLPVDTDFTSWESLAQTAISGTQFTAALSAIPARKIVVVFDCCHAGGLGEPKYASSPKLKAGLPESYYDALKKGRGRVILASSRDTEVSWVMNRDSNSLFTKYLLAGLRGGVASEDGLIRISDLFEYIQPMVTAEQPNQHPVFKANLEEFFPIALHKGGQKDTIPKDPEGFRYDVYISYAEKEPDDTWVWETLMPRLKDAGLRVAVSDDVLQGGVDRVVSIARGVEQAKRTLVVLSRTYLADYWLHFEEVVAQTIGIDEGKYRVLPVKIESIDEKQLPVHIKRMVIKDLSNSRHTERRLDNLVRELREPLPKMSAASGQE